MPACRALNTLRDEIALMHRDERCDVSLCLRDRLPVQAIASLRARAWRH